MPSKLVHSQQSTDHSLQKLWTMDYGLWTRNGFTYIEILIALAVIAVLFVPMIQLFSHCIYSVTVSGDMITAVNLARWEMERVKNLNVTTSGLKKQGDIWTPPLDELPFEMNHAKWRVLRHIDTGSEPLKVNVEVYRADNLNRPLASLVTLFADSIWVEKASP